MAAITTEISITAVGCPATNISAVTDAITSVIAEMALYVARKQPDAAPAVAAVATAAIGNIMDALAPPTAKSDVEPIHRHNVIIAGIQSGQHLVRHLPRGALDGNDDCRKKETCLTAKQQVTIGLSKPLTT